MIKNAMMAGVAVSCIQKGDVNGKQKKDLMLKNNIRASICKWPFSFLSLDELCVFAKSIGVGAIDLLNPAEWPVVQKHGLTCSMCYTNGETSLTEGWNDTKNHETLLKQFTEAIPLVSKNGYTNLICFSGNRHGMSDETGLENCVTGLSKLIPLAEKHHVILQMELFNSKVDHPDYMCDNTPWAIELCKRLHTSNFKLLYDIYHMQVNEGNIIDCIRKNNQYFGHYHTAGVPGRNELGPQQELNYPAVMKAIVETGFKGHVAQEFIPTGKTNEEKLAALTSAVHICDV